ncbi:hypothetical protein D3C72_1219370 [compost metagenome]
MARHDRQPGHTHPATIGFINDRHPRQQLIVARRHFLHLFEEVIVNLENQLQVTRQDPTNHVQRPGFQRFAHQRVVGVRKHLLDHRPGIQPAELMFVD